MVLAQSVLLLVILLIAVAYIIYADRKIWAAGQIRRGPNVVGPWGLLQSFADLLKFVVKEPVIPAGANKGLFLLAPFVTCISTRGLGRDPGQRGMGDRRHQCRHPLYLRDLLAQRVRHHHGRLGVELEEMAAAAVRPLCAPLSIFPRAYQPRMAELFRKAAPIEFGLGYRWRKNESNLLLAQKIATGTTESGLTPH